MNSVSFTIPGPPRGKGRPRFARRGAGVATYTDDRTAAYENLVTLAFRQEQQKAMSGPVMLEVHAFFPIPKSASKAKRHEMMIDKIYPTVKPDLDNVIKAVLDGLNGVAFEDDKQVVSIISSKHYDETPHVQVHIWEANARERP